MPPQVRGAGDTCTPAISQTPVKIEQPKSTEIDKKAEQVQKQEPPKQDAETTAKNAEAAKQHANDAKNVNTTREQMMKNHLANKLPGNKNIGHSSKLVTGSIHSPSSDLVRNDKQKDPDPEVRNLQQSLNAWRTSKGQEAVPEDGLFGEKTEKAVKEFQNTNGLNKQKGKADLLTRERLGVETDASFKRLEGNVQTEARRSMNQLSDNPKALKNLARLVKDDHFEKHTGYQKSMIQTQVKNPGVTTQMVELASRENFEKLSASTKQLAIDMVGRSAGTKNEGDVRMLVYSPRLHELPDKTQTRVLDIYRQRSIDAPGGKKDTERLGENLSKLVDSDGFQKIPHSMKTEILDRVEGYAGQPQKIDNLATVLVPGFSHLSKRNQEQILKVFYDHPGETQLAKDLNRFVNPGRHHALDNDLQTKVLNQINRNFYTGKPEKTEKLFELTHSDRFWPTKQIVLDNINNPKNIDDDLRKRQHQMLDQL